MDFLLDYIIPFLAILTIVVFVHELGHYLVARWNGVKIETFSIGFGPEVVGFNDRAGTRWKFSAVPLGGYVKMLGDEDASSKPGDTQGMSETDRKRTLQGQSVGARFAIVAAGPAMNFLFAIAVFAVVFMVMGQPKTLPIIGEVRDDSPAAAAGLQPGDRIVGMDGSEIDRFEEIQRMVQLSAGEPMSVTVERGGARVSMTVDPEMRQMTDAFGNEVRQPLIGITVSTEHQEIVRHGPVGAVVEGTRQTWVVTAGTIKAVGQIISGSRGTEELGGPIRIAQFSGQAADAGIIGFVMFIAILSVNLGLINLFPIPMLDGGHLLFYAIEALRGKPLPEQAQEYGFRIGLILVLTLMVFATWNDLTQLQVWDFLSELVS